MNSSVAIPANPTLVDSHIQLSWSLQAGCSAAMRSMVALLLSLLFIFVVLPKARTHIKLVRGYILVVLAVIVATS